MTTQTESIDSLVALHVTDDEMYSRYREEMTPLLEAHGGSFRYDFRVGQVLKSEAGHDLNRVFVISFPDGQARDTFFTNNDYLEIRRRFFEPSVGKTIMIGELTRA